MQVALAWHHDVFRQPKCTLSVPPGAAHGRVGKVHNMRECPTLHIYLFDSVLSSVFRSSSACLVDIFMAAKAREKRDVIQY